MRLSIVKKSHQQLLIEIAASLRSDDPRDGLEHVLNCWLFPCTQPAQALVQSPSLTEEDPSDDLSTLVSWD